MWGKGKHPIEDAQIHKIYLFPSLSIFYIWSSPYWPAGLHFRWIQRWGLRPPKQGLSCKQHCCPDCDHSNHFDLVIDLIDYHDNSESKGAPPIKKMFSFRHCPKRGGGALPGYFWTHFPPCSPLYLDINIMLCVYCLVTFNTKIIKSNKIIITIITPNIVVIIGSVIRNNT